MDHIHPIFDHLISRKAKENYLNQRSGVFWFTGLSGSGKSTIVQHLEKHLFSRGFFVQVLDGDNIRSGINNNLSFSAVDRAENIRRVAEVANLFKNAGIITLCSFISPKYSMRENARRIIGEDDFFEIYIKTPLEVCEERDVKGLYKKARAGVIKDFTGIDAPYEEPKDPFIMVETAQHSVEESVSVCLEKIEGIIRKS